MYVVGHVSRSLRHAAARTAQGRAAPSRAATAMQCNGSALGGPIPEVDPSSGKPQWWKSFAAALAWMLTGAHASRADAYRIASGIADADPQVGCVANDVAACMQLCRIMYVYISCIRMVCVHACIWHHTTIGATCIHHRVVSTRTYTIGESVFVVATAVAASVVVDVAVVTVVGVCGTSAVVTSTVCRRPRGTRRSTSSPPRALVIGSWHASVASVLFVSSIALESHRMIRNNTTPIE